MNEQTAATAAKLAAYSGRPLTLMEVCGTHTMNIARSGLRQLLPPSIRLISGPGCPVCVTPNRYFEDALALGRRDDVIIASFGDLLRVPVGNTSLLAQKRSRSNVRIVYSPLDCLDLAQRHPDKKVVFLSVGFETTAPLAALTLQKAAKMSLGNIYVLAGNKSILPAMRMLMADATLRVDGFLLPGNVAVITGAASFRRLLYATPFRGVVCGFAPAAILAGIETLAYMSDGDFANQYREAVSDGGNILAKRCMEAVFMPCDSEWRGLGNIADSGFKLRTEFARFDAVQLLDTPSYAGECDSLCRCADILTGKITPLACALFGRSCSPAHPIGPCMVSSEGTCSAYFMEVSADGKAN